MPLKLGRDHARVFIDEPPKQDPSGSVPGVPATVDACQLSDWTIWQATDWVLPGTLPADPGLRKGLWRLLDDPNDRRQMIAEETASYLTNCRRQQIGIIDFRLVPGAWLSSPRARDWFAQHTTAHGRAISATPRTMFSV
ncbi:MAG: hypothetical protein Q9206_001504 [Seirophora lacunosa]